MPQYKYTSLLQKSQRQIVISKDKLRTYSKWTGSIQIRLNNEGRDQNKLRLYKTFKGSFSEEPYLSLVPNRNQRAALTRLRVSAHRLQIEVGRYTTPPTPLNSRFCKYCLTEPRSVDSEFHFLFECNTFKLKRQCFLGRLSSLGIKIDNNWPEQKKIATVLCPTSAHYQVQQSWKI